MKKDQVFVEERKRAILEYVLTYKKATVQALCEKFGVSSVTIRTDLRDLEQTSPLVRTHGGVMLHDQARFEPKAEEKLVQHASAKQIIAALALREIDDRDTLIIDTGSTTQALAGLLESKRNITVLTNDIMIAMKLEQHPSVNIHLIGGVIRKHFHCSVGIHALETLKGLTVDKAFMGTNCFSIEKGATTPDLDQAQLKKVMISIASQVYLLADSSKMGKNSFAQFCPTDEINYFITERISDVDRQALEDRGIAVLSEERKSGAAE
jgi:DeoR family fructose operon transcriptional repressor